MDELKQCNEAEHTTTWTRGAAQPYLHTARVAQRSKGYTPRPAAAGNSLARDVRGQSATLPRPAVSGLSTPAAARAAGARCVRSPRARAAPERRGSEASTARSKSSSPAHTLRECITRAASRARRQRARQRTREPDRCWPPACLFPHPQAPHNGRRRRCEPPRAWRLRPGEGPGSRRGRMRPGEGRTTVSDSAGAEQSDASDVGSRRVGRTDASEGCCCYKWLEVT